MKHFKTISAFHAFVNLPAPQHPLISVVDVATVPHRYTEEPTSMVFDFYSISVKRMSNVKAKYGQHPFDFNEGILSFMSPNQVFSMAVDNEDEVVKKSGWVIYIHPDFIWNTSLAKTIKSYDFWDYSLHESLFLSAKEETIINNIIENIQQESIPTLISSVSRSSSRKLKVCSPTLTGSIIASSLPGKKRTTRYLAS